MMANVLIDTDVFSFVFKGDTRAQLYAGHLKGRTGHLAFTTVAELYHSSIRSRWGAARVNDLLRKMGFYAVLGYDDDVAWKWAKVTTIKGHPIAHGDAWIAAVALRHGLPLITHNRKDYEFIPGLTIISEA
jgi:tRNA(fMet)-specific endonuclease VapC